jgi:isoamylase
MEPFAPPPQRPSTSYPLGATVYPDGVNFCVFSKNCEAIELLLFDTADDPAPARVLRFDPLDNRTFYYWHMFVPGLRPGQLYAYRAYGPHDVAVGFRFDGWKVLLDPYALGTVMPSHYDRQAAVRPGDNCAVAMKSVVVDPHDYDWEGDLPLQLSYTHTVIYELHVRGFTIDPASGVTPAKRGTYAGLIEKIPYLKELGITSVELLPVQQFDPQDAPLGLNYWGYSPIGFFCPHAPYSSDQSPLGPINEFRDMVKAMHKAGLEVILDVVFNHTAEGDQKGPTLSFKGLENRAYYILEKDRTYYANYSGTGNSFNANHAIPRRLILDCLRYWVSEMHVDGFRFDLASVMARDEWGTPMKSPPILWDIESDPVLSGTKIIAEAWDAAGLYQVGSFIGHRWAEWNGKFRDDVRRFVKGDTGMVAAVVQRLMASPDLYPQPDRKPNRSINFITAHDGFTLNDLVAYNERHNWANGENNNDGDKSSFSWNCGTEGPSDDPEINALRTRQIKNFFTILLISQGTPMITMGDEVRRTQHGNNNAYCQDNEIGWFNWADVPRHGEMFRFVQKMIQFTHQGFSKVRFTQNIVVGAGGRGETLLETDGDGSAPARPHIGQHRGRAGGETRFYVSIGVFRRPPAPTRRLLKSPERHGD